MAVINCLILLSVTKKLSQNLFNFKRDFVSSLILGENNKNVFQYFYNHLKSETHFRLNLHEVNEKFTLLHLRKSLKTFQIHTTIS